jgi:acyl carrier protein
MIERIRRALTRAGMTELPDDIDAPLADHGMDSLIMVLSVAELEREFALSITAHAFSEESFRTLGAVRALVQRAGGSSP